MTLRALPWEWSFVRPLRFGGREYATRRGWLLRGDAADGRARFADVCPLPGFSIEDAADVERAFAGAASPPPSLSWALAVLGLSAGRAARVRSAGLVVGDEPAPEGFSTLKLKVGRGSLADDLRRVEAARATGARLRLDGNRALDLEAVGRLAEAAGDALEFLEEPVPPALLPAALAEAPVALDETLAGDGPPLAGAVAWVVKPTLLGAARTFELVELAGVHLVDVVVSSAFESAVGRHALVRLAAEVAPHVAHGLGTGAWFAEDFAGVLEAEGEQLVAAASFEVAQDAPWRTLDLEDPCTGS